MFIPLPVRGMNVHSVDPLRNEHSFREHPQELFMSTSKIVLITGATAGIGRTTALHLSSLGHHVIATGRKPAELAKIAREATGKLDTLLLDVTSPASIAAAV